MTPGFGIRLAIGARARDIVGEVVLQGMRMAGIGLAVGTALALALARAVRGLLVGVTTADPLAFVGAIALLGATVLVATYLPARRAGRVDPVVALRQE